MNNEPSVRAINAIETGQRVEVTGEEYIETVRTAIQNQAGKWIDEGQHVYAQIALMEVQRLDQLYPPF